MARKELLPTDVTAIIDTREQLPLTLSLPTMSGTLITGDYSILGLEHCIAVERKSLDDLVMCVGVERDRFDREMQRILAYPARAVVVEATWQQITDGGWRSRVTPQAAMGSLLGWIAAGVPIVMAGDREMAAKMVSRILFIAARRRWREAQALVGSLKLAGERDEKTA